MECQDCPPDDRFEGDIKQLCAHVVNAHERSWGDYKERYGVDDEELRRRNSRNSRKGWRLKKKQEEG